MFFSNNVQHVITEVTVCYNNNQTHWNIWWRI